MVSVKIKKLSPDAVVPKFAKPGDAGADLVATGVKKEGFLFPKYTYSTGIAMEIPEGHAGMIYPRSSVHKVLQFLTNSVGVVDSGYRGEIKAVFRGFLGLGPKYKPGDRIMQMVIHKLPQIEFKEVSELSESERGTGGFGSTGK